MGRQFNKTDYTFPSDHRRPDEVYDDERSLTVGDLRLELMHGRGETDDATFVWLPQRRILISGDFVIWVFPNAGNPRKVQRYAPDWAAALRYMRRLDPEILVPGHGPVVLGAARAAQMLEDGASALESLVTQTRDQMNRGRSLDEILHNIRYPQDLLAKPYLLPKYDDPEFVVRGIWHLYAGWHSGNPAYLKPAPEAALAGEIAALAGGAETLGLRAAALAKTGQLRLATHLIEFAVAASPQSRDLQRVREGVYAQRVGAETSHIGKAIFAAARRDAQARSAS
jgi:alkyl sulfatase BDS1-like metallo-beta-lactamase superfamily hydrolase